MEFDDSSLRFVFNVIGITTITSLSLRWALLERDKLSASDGKPRPGRSQVDTNSPAKAEMGESIGTASPALAPATRQDIREFVRHRIERWNDIRLTQRHSSFDRIPT